MSNTPYLSRSLESSDFGTIELRITREDDEVPAFAYTIQNTDGRVDESFTAYGEDDVQALLFCLTAAGDYFARFVPDASFVELGITGLPVTATRAEGEWRAEVVTPTVLPA
ncbi:hypothetical protein N8K70_08645 [Microbacterium betulae]|uniref:Uncharacterized protein n=1 Tax=Microbacterium betulae TaxID=2981139 RepID=A0AA97FFK0_9MICO|nr:hypothetical protein [Microbacterium sp. AB]WOF21469.1 hypothetical protein N8K70_08645 [Microbacterium sp. AB]